MRLPELADGILRRALSADTGSCTPTTRLYNALLSVWEQLEMNEKIRM